MEIQSKSNPLPILPSAPTEQRRSPGPAQLEELPQRLQERIQRVTLQLTLICEIRQKDQWDTGDVLIVTVVGLTALSEIGVNVAPLLAGAGIVGIAIGFGSQKLVQDLITGLFLLLENTVQVGDNVTMMITLHAGPSTCGNNQVDADEECDDGDRLSAGDCDFARYEFSPSLSSFVSCGTVAPPT